MVWRGTVLISRPDSQGDNAMLRYVYRRVFLAATLIAMLPSAPSFAVSAKEKMATCKFGADDQKLQGAARAKFMKNCMANRNDPRGPAAGATPASGAPAPAAGGAPPPKQ
jgi:hypothetical protein